MDKSTFDKLSKDPGALWALIQNEQTQQQSAAAAAETKFNDLAVAVRAHVAKPSPATLQTIDNATKSTKDRMKAEIDAEIQRLEQAKASL